MMQLIRNGNILGFARLGDVFTVTGQTADGTWFQVDYKGMPAYLYALLTIPNAAAKAIPVVK